MTTYTDEQIEQAAVRMVASVEKVRHLEIEGEWFGDLVASMLRSLLADRNRLQAEVEASRSIEVGGWQVRLTAKYGSEWESCTKECYQDTIRTGRYCGLPAGTKDVEVRQLYVFSNGEDANTRSPK